MRGPAVACQRRVEGIMSIVTAILLALAVVVVDPSRTAQVSGQQASSASSSEEKETVGYLEWAIGRRA